MYTFPRPTQIASLFLILFPASVYMIIFCLRIKPQIQINKQIIVDFNYRYYCVNNDLLNILLCIITHI